MPDSKTLKRAADAVAKVGRSLATPDDSTANELAAKKDSMQNAYKALGIPADEPESVGNEQAPKPASWERVGRKYGDRPGEKTYTPEQMREMTHPLGSILIPSYDEGGEVDSDQTAQLHKDELVVPAEKVAQVESEHPELAHPTKETAEIPAPQQESQNKAQGILGSALSPTPAPRFGETGFDYKSAASDLIQQDKQNAAKNGDLVGFGKALINEKHFGEPGFDYTSAAKSVSPLGKVNLTGEPTEPAKHEPISASTSAPMSFKDKLKDYDHQIMNALDMAATTNDPAWQERADRLKLAKLEYQNQNPWGSAGNHPGVLGKIAHVASRIGNIAGGALAPDLLAEIPGTALNKAARRGALGEALKTDTADRIASEAEQNKSRIAEIGRTPEQITFNKLLKTINPATRKLYTEDEALQQTKGDEQQKEKENYINDRIKTLGETRSQATEAYYTMRAGTRPPNEREAEIKDYLKAKGLPDTPENRDLARQEILRRHTDIAQRAALPYSEQKIRLQNELAEAKSNLDSIRANALQRGEKADDLTEKENARHNMVQKQIDAVHNALDSADTNMLAASIVPVLATMTETTAQGIKRLNPQELARFMPKSSGDAMQWFEANYDKLTAGQVPPQYQKDLRQLLKNLEDEENQQTQANLKSIDDTIRHGAVAPDLNNQGKPTKTTPSRRSTDVATPEHNKYHFTGKNGEIFSNDGTTWYDAKGKKVGK
jgi:hypothetical protein